MTKTTYETAIKKLIAAYKRKKNVFGEDIKKIKKIIKK